MPVVMHEASRDGQMHPSLTSLGSALNKSRVSENALRLTERVLQEDITDPHVLSAFIASNLDTMRPRAYEAWILSMHRNFHRVREMVGFDPVAGTAQLCALIHGVATLKRRVAVSEAQEFSLLVLSFVLLKEGRRKASQFFYENGDGLTLKDVGLARFMMDVPADELEASIQRLARAMRATGSDPMRTVELELALSGSLVPIMRVGGL